MRVSISGVVYAIMLNVSTTNTLEPNGPILSTQHLTRMVGTLAIVNDVTFQVKSGEVLAIVGPSGSGKSSLLRLLNRLDEPTSGTVFFEGKDYRQLSARELRRRVGMVTQRAFLFPGTVLDNLRFGPRQRGEVLSDATGDALLNGTSRGGTVAFCDQCSSS